jgi:DNA-binding beta-propeller fold protein YncE
VWVLYNNGSIKAHYDNTSIISPSSVAADASGLIYVTDLSLRSVIILYPNGSLYSTIPVLSTPTGIAVNPAGTLIHVATPALNATLVYSSNGQLQCVIQAGFSGPSAVAVDSAGLLYVGDTMNQRVVVLDVAGESCHGASPSNAASVGAEISALSVTMMMISVVLSVLCS